MKTKIFAMYLPQYHEIPENNEFWGKGYTDWVGVKNAKPLYKNHLQPRIPLNENYYDLSKKESLEWQSKIAAEYGITGFGIYHYWFNDETNLLTKPAKILLENKNIKISFFFAWDNISWKRTWSSIKGNDWSPIVDDKKNKSENPLLIEYALGNEDNWKSHFDYLSPFFLDERYEKHNNKPIFLIYHYEDRLLDMAKYWDSLAKEIGFDGIEIIYRFDKLKNIPSNQLTFKYEPPFSGWNSFFSKVKNKLYTKLKMKKLRSYGYDKIWKKIIKRSKKNNSIFYSAFVNYDDTPRRGSKGRVVTGGTPEKFGYYLSNLVKIAEKEEHSYIFITAWNEWGEGAYLEPDTTNNYSYLEAIKKIKEEI